MRFIILFTSAAGAAPKTALYRAVVIATPTRAAAREAGMQGMPSDERQDRLIIIAA